MRKLGLNYLPLLLTIITLLFFPAHSALASPSSAAEGQVIVCHNAGKLEQHTIEINEVDLTDHLDHGDLEGPCAPLQETVAYSCSISNIEYETLYVSSATRGAQKGTLKAPFGSISLALQYAEKENFPGVELQIGPGVYSDDAAVASRPTRIVGPGRNESPTAELSLSITNDGGFELGIQGVVFMAGDSGPAIAVNNPVADTALCDVKFESVYSHAVSQTGGSIFINDSDFNFTAREPGADSEDHLTGTAIVLNGGAKGVINDIHVSGSSGSGLYVSGVGTKVDMDWGGSSQSVFENGTGCLGTVVINNGAEFNASHLLLDNNRVRGINVEGNGTVANLPFLTVTSTQFLAGGSDVTLETCGFNVITGVLAHSGATLNITGNASTPFIISDSNTAGLITTGIEPPTISLSNGTISNHLIGIAVVPPDAASCQIFHENVIFDDYSVSFVNNEVDFQTCYIPPPPPLPEFACDNGIDDDGDGLIDRDDPDCEGYPYP